MKKLILFLLLMMASPALAGTAYYFDPGATAGTGVGTFANPFYTMAQANAKAFATGDDLYFKVGTTYNVPAGEYLNIDWNGTSGDWAIVGAYYGENLFGLNGGARPIVNGNNAAPSTTSYLGLIDKNSHPTQTDAYVEVKDLKLQNSGYHGIQFHTLKNSKITNCYTYHTYGSGLVVARSDTVTIDGNTVEDSIYTSIGGAAIEITGVDAPNTCRNIVVSNNIVFNGGFEGIGTYKYVTYATISGNIIYDCRQPHIYVDASKFITISGNIIYKSSTPRWPKAQAIIIDNEQERGYCFIGSSTISGNYIANMAYGVTMAVNRTGCVLADTDVYDNVMADNTYNFMIWSPTAGWSGNDFYQNISYTSNNSTMYHSNDYSPTGVIWGHNIFDDSVSGNAAANAHTVMSPLDITTGWNALTAGAVTTSTFSLSSAGAAAVVSFFGDTPICENPAISPNGGSFETSVSVTITTGTSGAAIYYTTNGTTPTAGSTLYSGAITLSATTTLKAIAIKASYGNSAVTTAVFTKTAVSQAPYGGTAWTIPGSIYPWNYDTGGEGVAYHATSSGNQGDSTYRTDDMDIWVNGLPGAEAYASIFATGEWLEFTINVASTANYVFTFNLGAPVTGKTFSATIDGGSILGTTDVPNMGSELGYQYGNNVSTTAAEVTAGEHVLRITGVAGSFNAYKITGTADAPATPAAPANFVIIKGP